MREQADDKGNRDAAEAPRPAQPDWDQIEAFDRNRHHIWEALNKALNTLILGHAAGLVTCLTLLKDYKDQGLGIFIRLFGAGLIIAAISVLLWTVYAARYIEFPWGKRVAIPHGWLFLTTAACALLSTGLMVSAILIAVFKFGKQ